MKTEIKSAHTPGPWTLRSYLGNPGDIYAWAIDRPKKGTVLALVEPQEWKGITVKDNEADARLISAAPDLLEACQLSLARESAQEVVTGDGDKGLIVMLRAAIQKAKGK